jgi:hypothetical protein
VVPAQFVAAVRPMVRAQTSITKNNTNTSTATSTTPGVSHTDFPTAANVSIALPLDLKTVEWSYMTPQGTHKVRSRRA